MYENIKKIELHLHLDGCVRVKTATELLKQNNLRKKMVVENNNTSLTEYLTKFNIPNIVMQTKENLQLISKELIEDLIKDNVIYAEIRFSPLLHTKKGLTFEEIIDSVLKGLKNDTVKTNIILCMMRNASFEDNMKVIEVAKKYLNNGVVGIDLAGDEKKYPTSLFTNLFKKVNELKIPLTIHAGEASSSNSIKSAVNYVDRIGHGISLIDDKNLLNIVKEKNITLEICPSSNVQTKAVPSFEKHPLKEFVKQGILITINTDNRTVSDTSLNKEYKLLNKYFNYTVNDFKEFNINAINASFLSSDEKLELINKIK